MNKITIKDVAREAGVSIATVSNALNGSDVVQPKTREHVIEAAWRLNYIPNASGRQLRAAQSHTIGLFVTSMTGSYYGDMADSIHYLWAITATRRSCTIPEPENCGKTCPLTISAISAVSSGPGPGTWA